MASHSTSALTRIENIARAILVLRGHRVLLDAELAALYWVTTRRLNEQVRRNRSRFPADFLFELTAEEFANLKSHFILRHQVGAAAASSRSRSIGFTADLEENRYWISVDAAWRLCGYAAKTIGCLTTLLST